MWRNDFAQSPFKRKLNGEVYIKRKISSLYTILLRNNTIFSKREFSNSTYFDVNDNINLKNFVLLNYSFIKKLVKFHRCNKASNFISVSISIFSDWQNVFIKFVSSTNITINLFVIGKKYQIFIAVNLYFVKFC